MTRFAALMLAALLLPLPAAAQCVSTWLDDCKQDSGGYGQGQGRSSGYDVRGDPNDYGDRVSPYSPNRPDRRYEQQPTFGDPDRYRDTDPRRCTGLLCD